MNKNTHPKKQQGFVLITSVLFLGLLTMLGITALETTNLEDQMTRNVRYQAIAKQAAESALRDAEALAATIEKEEDFLNPVIDGLYNGLVSSDNEQPDELVESNWTTASAQTAVTDIANVDNNLNPSMYFITYEGMGLSEGAESKFFEHSGSGVGDDPIAYLRATGRGVAADGVTASIIQIHFATRLER